MKMLKTCEYTQMKVKVGIWKSVIIGHGAGF